LADEAGFVGVHFAHQDQVLIAGDREQLAARCQALIDAHGPALRRMVASYENVPQTREDLFQEILLALWKALPRFRGESSERTFAFRIAHNRCLSHICRREPRFAIADDPPEVVDQRPNPETQAIQARSRRTLREAIAMLPLGQRQVLQLALEDLAPAEIADVLGITEKQRPEYG